MGQTTTINWDNGRKLREFDRAWTRGESPAIETVLSTFDDSNGVLGELVYLECHHRLRRSQTVLRREYLDRFAGNETEVTGGYLLARLEHGVPSHPDYEQVRFVAEGSFGRVFHAFDRHLNRWAALKVPRDLNKHEGVLEGLAAEAARVARLRHAGVVSVYSFHPGTDDDPVPFVAMEWVPGSTLDKVDRTQWTRARSIDLMIEICDAVDAAHREGILHCDLKPANILLDKEQRPRVSDFGLAQDVSDPKGRRGTLLYRSPQSCRGETSSVADDVWALGVMLHELLVGRRPVDAAPDETELQLRERIAGLSTTLLTENLSSTPAPLRRICTKALNPDPRGRYASAALLGRDLRYWQNRKRRRLVRTVAVAVAIVLLTLTAWLHWQKQQRERSDTIAWVDKLTEDARQLVVSGDAETARSILTEARSKASAYGHFPASFRFLYARAQDSGNAQAIAFGSEQEPILSARISPDGRLLAGVLADQSVGVWNVQSGQQVMRTPAYLDAPQLADWTARGDRLMTVSGSVATVWNVGTGQLEYECRGHQMDIRRACFSRDGLRVATASVDNTARVWANEGATSIVLTGHEKSVTSVRWGAAGDRILTASTDKQVGIWDTRSGTHLGWLIGMHSAVDDIAISPDGSFAAAYSMIGDSHIRVWDMRTGELKHATDRGLATLQMAPRFSEDSKRCVFAFEEGADARIVLADAMSGRRLQEFKGHNGLIASADLTADGARLATGSFDKTVRVWDVDTGKELFQASDPTASLSMRAAITPDGGHLLTYPGNGVWQVRSLTNGALLNTLAYETLSVDRDRRLVRQADGRVRFLTDGKVGEPLPVPEHTTLIALPGGRVAYAGGNLKSLVILHREGTSTVIDTGYSVEACESLVPNTSGDRIVVVPRWQYVVAADIRLFDLEQGKGIATIRHTGKVLGSGFVGKTQECLLAIESTEGPNRVEIWSMDHPEAARCVLKTTSRMPTVATFSPDGMLVAIGDGDNGAEVWHLEEARQVCRVQGHTGSFVNAVAFHPDGALFATAGADRAVRVWDVATGKCLSIYSAHTATITRLFWTRRPDAQDAGLTDAASIEASCADGTTRCWSASLSMHSGE